MPKCINKVIDGAKAADCRITVHQCWAVGIYDCYYALRVGVSSVKVGLRHCYIAWDVGLYNHQNHAKTYKIRLEKEYLYLTKKSEMSVAQCENFIHFVDDSIRKRTIFTFLSYFTLIFEIYVRYNVDDWRCSSSQTLSIHLPYFTFLIIITSVSWTSECGYFTDEPVQYSRMTMTSMWFPFQRKMLVIVRVTCVFSRVINWRVKNASCSIYPCMSTVTSQVILGGW